jgi:hypothetical protein
MSYAYEPSPKPTWWKELTEKEQIEWYNGYIKALKDVITYGNSNINGDLENARRELFLLTGRYERNTDKEITMLDMIMHVTSDIKEKGEE